MAQTPSFANIAELSALNVFTFLSISFTIVSVSFKVIVPKTSQLTCHSFTGDLHIVVQNKYTLASNKMSIVLTVTSFVFCIIT